MVLHYAIDIFLKKISRPQSDLCQLNLNGMRQSDEWNEAMRTNIFHYLTMNVNYTLFWASWPSPMQSYHLISNTNCRTENMECYLNLQKWDTAALCNSFKELTKVDRLVKERYNSSALAMELRLSCTNPSKCRETPQRQQIMCTAKSLLVQVMMWPWKLRQAITWSPEPMVTKIPGTIWCH